VVLLYMDPGALVKLVVDEDGSEVAARLWDGADLVACSSLGHVEVCAALSAALRARRLTAAGHDTALDRWTEAYWPAVAEVPLTADIAHQAGKVAHRAALRGADAVHAASARTIPGAVLVAWDSRLREGARSLALDVAPTTI
jgi:predicted nucleic acid-binding protein